MSSTILPVLTEAGSESVDLKRSEDFIGIQGENRDSILVRTAKGDIGKKNWLRPLLKTPSYVVDGFWGIPRSPTNLTLIDINPNVAHKDKDTFVCKNDFITNLFNAQLPEEEFIKSLSDPELYMNCMDYICSVFIRAGELTRDEVCHYYKNNIDTIQSIVEFSSKDENLFLQNLPSDIKCGDLVIMTECCTETIPHTGSTYSFARANHIAMFCGYQNEEAYYIGLDASNVDQKVSMSPISENYKTLHSHLPPGVYIHPRILKKGYYCASAEKFVELIKEKAKEYKEKSTNIPYITYERLEPIIKNKEKKEKIDGLNGPQALQSQSVANIEQNISDFDNRCDLSRFKEFIVERFRYEGYAPGFHSSGKIPAGVDELCGATSLEEMKAIASRKKGERSLFRNPRSTQKLYEIIANEKNKTISEIKGEIERIEKKASSDDSPCCIM